MSGRTAAPESAIARLARRARVQPQADAERCDLCAQDLDETHRHLLDVSNGKISCACPACALLFDRREAGGNHYRLIPRRRMPLTDFELDQVLWAGLGIPVDLAFFVRTTRYSGMTAFYPSPLGTMTSALSLSTWDQVEAANPRLREMESDVEALLINRASGARTFWILPLDDCYRLVATLRLHWQGINGGSEVWKQIQQFFEGLRPTSEWGSRL